MRYHVASYSFSNPMIEVLATAFVLAAALVLFALRNWALWQWRSRDRSDDSGEKR